MGQLLSATDDEVEVENEKVMESSDDCGQATSLLSEKVYFCHSLSLFIQRSFGGEWNSDSKPYLLEPRYRYLQNNKVLGVTVLVKFKLTS